MITCDHMRLRWIWLNQANIVVCLHATGKIDEGNLLCFLSFFFPSFPCYFRFKSKHNWTLNWTNMLNPILNLIYFMFDLSLLLPPLPFLVPSFIFLFGFKLFFCSTFLFPFPSWSSKFSNLAITCAITVCWKRDPGRGIDSFGPNKKKGSTKKWTGSISGAFGKGPFGKGSVAFSDAMAYSDRDKGCQGRGDHF